MTTGHDGSLATVHASSPRGVVTRLESLASMQQEVARNTLRDQISSGVDVIVHLEKQSGVRRVANVDVLTPLVVDDRTRVRGYPVFAAPLGSPEPRCFALPPATLERLNAAGESLKRLPKDFTSVDPGEPWIA